MFNPGFFFLSSAEMVRLFSGCYKWAGTGVPAAQKAKLWEQAFAAKLGFVAGRQARERETASDPQPLGLSAGAVFKGEEPRNWG